MSIYDALVEQYGIIMKPNDVAKVLHQHPTHIRELCQRGELPAVKIGKRWLIPTDKFANSLQGQE